MKIKNHIIICILVSVNILTGKSMKTNDSSTLTITSQSFTNGQTIPAKHSYKNQNISPQLSWGNAPVNTKSFAIICDDPDAPTPTPWVHWIIFNIPATITSLPEGFSNTTSNGIQQGTTSYKQVEWGGPNPPSGIHRYFFKVYALDIMLSNLKAPNKEQLLTAIKNHILASGEIMGIYQASTK